MSTSATSSTPADDTDDHYNVIIVGGGVMGCSTAWHLLAEAPGLSVVVVEPDPAYDGAASSFASGGVRQLFSRAENVLMSRYTHEVIESWTSWQPPSGEADPAELPDLGWHPNGYLFITDTVLSDQLHTDFEQQLALGVEAVWMDPDQIRERYPLISTHDLGPAILSPRDGWLSPSALLEGMGHRARRLGRASFATGWWRSSPVTTA